MITLSHHFTQSTSHSPLLSTLILADDDTDTVIMRTRDARKMRKEIKRRGLTVPSEMGNRVQQWTVNLK